MSPYAWANDTEAQLTRMQGDKAADRRMQSAVGIP